MAIPVDEGKNLAIERPALNWINYGNLLAYVLNIVFTYGVGIAGWLGTPNNGELSEKYQTLITPNSSAFSIWAVIFVFQGLFAVVQMFPSFRARPLVQDGVSFWYILVCCTQIGWTFTFAYETIEAALFFMIAIWICLMALITSQYYVKQDSEDLKCSSKNGLLEFWLLKFPFSIHGGWITAATALNVSVVTVYNQSAAATQLAVAIICLAVLHAISVWHLFGYKRPNYTIPCVLIWATGWIYAELQQPKQLIVDTFDESVIDAVAYAAFSVSMIIIIQVVVRLGYFTFSVIRGSRFLEVEQEEE